MKKDRRRQGKSKWDGREETKIGGWEAKNRPKGNEKEPTLV